MKQKWVAFGIVVVFAGLCVWLLTGCAGMGSPKFSIETDYGRFSYELPEMKGLKK
jgi:hypothetical protein